jgi:transposase
MISYREILRLYSQGFSQRSIAASVGCGKGTVQRTIAHAKEHNLELPLLPEMTDEKLRHLFSQADGDKYEGYKEPDFEQIHRDMSKRHMTLSLLWNEYSMQCRQNDTVPYKYTAFCNRYRDYIQKTKATMHLHRRPGEQMEVDWAGQTMEIVDSLTGEIISAYIFVAVLSYSGYTYVEAFLSRNQESWIDAHINAYRHFGGSTRILVPDNLKTGVTRVNSDAPVINRVYREMSEHYNTAVLPARVRKPKDKPGVEGTVGVISTWILAALRNWKFFSLRELNEAIFEKLAEFNQKSFQKKPGSRQSVFSEEERPLLQPLPDKPFEMSEWKVCIVAYNYHISVDKMYYSVPCEHIKKEVGVRLTGRTIEIFLNGERIASHVRKYGYAGQYSTLSEHMPEDHRKYTQWNAERFLSWGRSIGVNTVTVVKGILESRKIEQQGYRAAMALLKLSDKYSPDRLEAACERALTYTPAPSFKSIQTILATGQETLPGQKPKRDASAKFGITRGPEYYGGDSDA